MNDYDKIPPRYVAKHLGLQTDIANLDIDLRGLVGGLNTLITLINDGAKLVNYDDQVEDWVDVMNDLSWNIDYLRAAIEVAEDYMSIPDEVDVIVEDMACYMESDIKEEINKDYLVDKLAGRVNGKN